MLQDDELIKGRVYTCEYGHEYQKKVIFTYSHTKDDGHVEIWFSKAKFISKNSIMRQDGVGFMSYNLMRNIREV